MSEYTLVPVSENAMNAYKNALPAITTKAVKKSMQNKDETEQHGKDAENLLKSGFDFTAQMLESVMQVGDVALLEDQLLWAQSHLVHEKVMPVHILHRFQIYAQVVQEEMDEKYSDEIMPYLNWMIKKLESLISK